MQTKTLSSRKSNANLRNSSIGDRIFGAFVLIVMLTTIVVTLYPFLNVLSLSLSGPGTTYGSGLIPKEISFKAYEMVISNSAIWVGYCNTLVRVVGATVLSLLVTTLAAYAWSKRELPFRSLFTGIILFTMFFNGGLIPNYLLIRNYGMMNTMWALILPRLVDTFALIIMRNFFFGIPASLEESARIDGAGDFRILIQIVLPISLPIVATVVMWNAVWHWNAWFDAMLYVSKPELRVLQLVLRNIVLEGTQQVISSVDYGNEAAMSNPDVVKAATVIVATVPIISIYPFIQKYYVKGMTVGAVKG